MNWEGHRSCDNPDKEVQNSRDHDQRCGDRRMVKPNQGDVDQDAQKKQGDIYEKDPMVDEFVNGRKIFCADKLPGRIICNALNRSAAKRVDRQEEIEDRHKFSYGHHPTPREHNQKERSTHLRGKSRLAYTWV